jgi:hypothetical protein
MTGRRFPPPWSVEEGETYFVVKDNDGQQLAYVYFEDEPGGDWRPSYSVGIMRGPDNKSFIDE